jgi:uncharacterized membrane protein YcaP (DUF421 family)
MDLLHIAARVLFAYVVLLALVRVSGKRLLKHATPLDFVVALILGDMMDDLMWGEVDASVFVVAVGVLMLIHVSLDLVRFRAGRLR